MIVERRRIDTEDRGIIGGDTIPEILVSIRRQLILACADVVRCVAAATLHPNVDVIDIATSTETVKDDELLEVGYVTDVALLKVATGLESDGEGVIECAVTASEVVSAKAVVCCAVVIASGVVAIVWVAKEGDLCFLSDVVSLVKRCRRCCCNGQEGEERWKGSMHDGYGTSYTSDLVNVAEVVR